MVSNFREIEEPEIDLRHYYLVLLKHKFLIITCLVLTVAVTMFLTLQMEPVYQATSTVLIERPQTVSPLTGQYTPSDSFFSESLTFNTHFKLITSRPVLERVVRELKLDQPGTGKKPVPPGGGEAWRFKIARRVCRGSVRRSSTTRSSAASSLR